jgi:hypothetical protein
MSVDLDQLVDWQAPDTWACVMDEPTSQDMDITFRITLQEQHMDCNDEDDALTEAEETAAAAMLAAVFEDDDEDDDDALTEAEETAATAMLVAVFEDDDEDEAIADGPSVEQMALAGQPWSYSTEEMELHDIAVHSDPDDVVSTTPCVSPSAPRFPLTTPALVLVRVKSTLGFPQ